MYNSVLITDYYEFSMAYAYFKQNKHKQVGYFDVFVRRIPDKGGYYIFNGLHKFIDFVLNFKFSETQLEYLQKSGLYDDDFIDYLRNLKLDISVYSVKEGTPVFANEPVVTVVGTLIQAQIIETFLLQNINYASLVATKATRISSVDKNKQYLEFGTRRAHGSDASIEGARAAYIGGFYATSNTEAGLKYNIPAVGTMAHSYVQIYEDEYEAFLSYAKVFPENCVFLVDTYDTLKSGVPNAIKVAKEFLIPNGHSLKGIRLDSGDLSYLSKQARKMLDDAGLYDTKIMASNSLDEFVITDLLLQNAPIDIFGVGENLITSKSHPVMGGVYKVVAYMENGEVIPTIKLSDTIDKITNPGFKRLYRFYDKDSNKALADLIACHDEIIPDDNLEIFSPTEPWKRQTLTNYYFVELQNLIINNGKLVYDIPSLEEVKAYCESQLETLWPEVRRLNQAHQYYVDLSQKLYDLKNDLIIKKREISKK